MPRRTVHRRRRSVLRRRPILRRSVHRRRRSLGHLSRSHRRTVTDEAHVAKSLDGGLGHEAIVSNPKGLGNADTKVFLATSYVVTMWSING